MLTVRSAYGATATANASVVVTWPTFNAAADVAGFVDDASARAAASLQSGDSTAALQVVSGLAVLLNSNDTVATPTAAANNTTVSTQRASLLSIVATAVTQSPTLTGTSSSVESTAALVQQLVSSPSQLSDDGLTSAFTVLGAVAAAPAGMSPAAAQSVVTALSAVATAPSVAIGASLSANGTSVGATVLGVLDTLASSQASGMSVAGQAAAVLATPHIQMSVSLDDSVASERLFNGVVTAPGSNSTFGPLPPGTLAAAGGGLVSTVFLSLAFDAHAAPNSTNASAAGVTRLLFRDAGTLAIVPVQNLSRPLLFTLPTAPLGAAQTSACTWWDEVAGAYTGTECASAPNPAPPGHSVAFNPVFVASSQTPTAVGRCHDCRTHFDALVQSVPVCASS